MDSDTFVTRKLNRIKARTAKFVQLWCRRCDIAVVSDSKRCHVCGYRSEEKRIKDFGIKD